MFPNYKPLGGESKRSKEEEEVLTYAHIVHLMGGSSQGGLGWPFERQKAQFQGTQLYEMILTY